MRNLTSRTCLNETFRFVFVVVLLALVIQSATASNVRGHEAEGSGAVVCLSGGGTSPGSKNAEPTSSKGASSAVYADAIRLGPQSEAATRTPSVGVNTAASEVRSRYVSITVLKYRVDDVSTETTTVPTQGSSAAPITAGEKFNLFVKKSFLSPGAYALSALTGIYGEWLDDDHYHSQLEDFAADSGTRAARSFAFRATANFFEKFAYA